MTFTNYLEKPERNKFYFWFLYTLFLINDILIKNKYLERHFWHHLKCQLFYVGGNCQNTGLCCQSIQLVHEKKTISSLSRFYKISKKNVSFSRFIPQYTPKRDLRFFCTQLSTDNLCLDYMNRPQVCRNYPFSNFLLNIPLHTQCGYSIKESNLSYKNIHNPRFRQLVTEFKINQNLI